MDSLHVLERPKKQSFLRRHLGFVLLFCLALLTALLLFFASLFPAFAEWLAMGPCAWVRLALGAVSSIFPFCLSELLVLMLALFLLCYPVLCIVGIVRAAKKKKPSPLLRKLLSAPLALLLLVAVLFSLSFGPCYHRASLAQRMGLSTPVTQERLFQALEFLIEEINTQVPLLQFNEKGQAVLPADFSKTAEKINQAYQHFAASYDFLQSQGFDAKPILLSQPMTYTHVSGIYTFFTGESAVNTNYPDYLLPYTIAHEYSHQRGIAPENEANFLAFAVLMSSEDPYLRYSGAANVFSALANKAYSLDKDRYYQLISTLSPALSAEYAAYREFFKPYEHSTAGKVANAANNSYLKANGQSQGTVSYSLITTLVVNYCCDVLK